MFGFYVRIWGRPANWVVSIVFMLVGAIIFSFVPTILQPSPDRGPVLIILHIFGGIFFGLGSLIFLWMMGDAYFKFRHSPYRDTWYWWGNFIGPLLAAGLFAVPATFTFPLMLLAYLFSPNIFFPANSPDVTNNLVVGLIFSVVGLLSLTLMYFVGRSMYKKRPHRRHRTG